ncbi:Tyrosine recombinase XerC [subsurface metagenome]
MSNVPKTLTVLETHQLLDSILVKEGTDKQFHRAVRNYAMALCMLDAGLRVGELVKLHWSDLFFNCEPVNSIIIRSAIAKKGRERTVPVSQRLGDALKSYHEYYRPTRGEFSTAYCFYQTEETAPLTTRQVERIIRAAAMKSLGRPIHPHVLRHTFATKLMRKTNARIVQELLGHEHLSSTQIYTHPNSEDLTNAINSLDNGD